MRPRFVNRSDSTKEKKKIDIEKEEVIDTHITTDDEKDIDELLFGDLELPPRKRRK